MSPSPQKKSTIEWTCPEEGERDEILKSLIKRYEQESYEQEIKSANVPADPRPCIFSGYGFAHGSFQKGFCYHLGIAEVRSRHSKDVYIKGFAPDDPKKPLFSAIFFFVVEKSQPPKIENS